MQIEYGKGAGGQHGVNAWMILEVGVCLVNGVEPVSSLPDDLFIVVGRDSVPSLCHRAHVSLFHYYETQ